MRSALLSPFVAGLLFGLGLCLSEMIDPGKVEAFLDLGGEWDPSLAFVMAGAIAVAFPAFRTAGKRQSDLFGEPLDPPMQNAIDAQLIVGAVLFGAGWGLVGLCPGPALADAFLDWRALAFVCAMLAGMAIHAALARSTGSASVAALGQDG